MKISDLLTKADGDYPSLEGVYGNEKDLALLKKAFSSCSSETTAVLQYIFQSYVCKDVEVCKILRKIAITEMHHHETFGEIITKLGGIPYYTNGHGGNYTTQCVYEGKNVLEMLNQNIKDEQGAVDYYEGIKKLLSNQKLVDIVDRIILDELVHIDAFNKLIEYITFYKDK